MGKTLTLSGLITVFAVLAAMYRPVRVLCLCAAALIAAIWVLSALKKRKEKWTHIAYVTLFSLLCGGAAAFLFLEFQIVTHGETDNETPVSAVVILGAGVNGTEPSVSLLVRLEAALDYLADRPDIPVIVTGGKGSKETITEAQCMANWLMANGVEKSRIYLEEQAENTRENVEFSQALLKKIGIDATDHIAVVTADYHLYRASLYWGMPWMVPVASKMPDYDFLLTINYYIREVFAVAKLLVLGR